MKDTDGFDLTALRDRYILVLEKLCEGRDLVDMFATDIPDLAAWSVEVDKLLEEMNDHET